VWDDSTPGNPDILYRRSTDVGNTFPNIIKNLSGNTGSSSDPAISLSSNNVYVVWGDFTPGNNEIIYRTSANNGDTFPSLLTNLSVNVATSSAPAIAAS
jgi:LEA14-like dessication related protein